MSHSGKRFDDPMTQIWFEKWSAAEDDWAAAVVRLQTARAAFTAMLIPGMTAEQMRAAAASALEDTRR